MATFCHREWFFLKPFKQWQFFLISTQTCIVLPPHYTLCMEQKDLYKSIATLAPDISADSFVFLPLILSHMSIVGSQWGKMKVGSTSRQFCCLTRSRGERRLPRLINTPDQSSSISDKTVMSKTTLWNWIGWDYQRGSYEPWCLRHALAVRINGVAIAALAVADVAVAVAEGGDPTLDSRWWDSHELQDSHRLIHTDW